jgi:hypothetical protein
MPRAERLNIIRELETSRKSKVLVYFCGDRRATGGTRIADDSIRPIYDHLRAVASLFPTKRKKLDFYLYSIGGLTETPWKIVTMLREFSDELNVIIPYKAYSAATMIAIGADKIWMSDKAELGPIDPALQFVENPNRPLPFLLPEVGVEDIASFITFLRQRAGLTDQSALAATINTLATNLTPPLLGRIERIYSHIRLVARKLLAECKPPLDETRVAAIVEALTEKTYVHGHGIGRREAKQIGLQVMYLDEDDATLVWRLFKEYEEALLLAANPDPASYFPNENASTYSENDVDGAFIESTELLHAFRGSYIVQRIRRVPQQPTINVNLNLNLPPGIQAQDIPVQLQQAIQQILQGGATQIQQAVTDEIARQSPVDRVEGRFSGQWKLLDGQPI